MEEECRYTRRSNSLYRPSDPTKHFHAEIDV